MKSYYEELNVEKIHLDYENPRISLMVERFRDNISSELISMALGGGSGETSGTSFHSLKESIKTNGGIIHPIIVNYKDNNKYIVIEGNTRVQIYREFLEDGVPGCWSKIRAIVYENLDEESIHAIRLQAHLVGPRDWDPYSKAKYLNYLSNNQKLSINQIISFCGGDSNEIRAMISAYHDMEKYYRPQLGSDDQFEQRKFSAFKELQNKRIQESIFTNGFSKKDFAEWVIEGNIDKMAGVRKLPAILSHNEAKKQFLKGNVTEAIKFIDMPEGSGEYVKNIPYLILANALSNKLAEISYSEIKRLQRKTSESDRSILLDLKENLDEIVEDTHSEDY